MLAYFELQSIRITSSVTSLTGTITSAMLYFTHLSRSIVTVCAEYIRRSVSYRALTERCHESWSSRCVSFHGLLEQIAAEAFVIWSFWSVTRRSDSTTKVLPPVTWVLFSNMLVPCTLIRLVFGFGVGSDQTRAYLCQHRTPVFRPSEAR